MSKCSTCRKADALDTTWEKIRYWFFSRFHQDILDLGSQKYTQGFADGYTVGFKHASEPKRGPDDSYAPEPFTDDTTKIS